MLQTKPNERHAAEVNDKPEACSILRAVSVFCAWWHMQKKETQESLRVVQSIFVA